MKEQTFLISEERQNFIVLSEKLRGCLESKLDELFQKNGFQSYLNQRDCLFVAPDSDIELMQSTIGANNDNKVFAGSACMAVKTWCGMYYDDRISVLEKFFKCYKRFSYNSDFTPTIDISIFFSKVLFTEFTAILNDKMWRPISQYYRQGFNANMESRYLGQFSPISDFDFFNKN